MAVPTKKATWRMQRCPQRKLTSEHNCVNWSDVGSGQEEGEGDSLTPEWSLCKKRLAPSSACSSWVDSVQSGIGVRRKLFPEHSPSKCNNVSSSVGLAHSSSELDTYMRRKLFSEHEDPLSWNSVTKQEVEEAVTPVAKKETEEVFTPSQEWAEDDFQEIDRLCLQKARVSPNSSVEEVVNPSQEWGEADFQEIDRLCLHRTRVSLTSSLEEVVTASQEWGEEDFQEIGRLCLQKTRVSLRSSVEEVVTPQEWGEDDFQEIDRLCMQKARVSPNSSVESPISPESEPNLVGVIIPRKQSPSKREDEITVEKELEESIISSEAWDRNFFLHTDNMCEQRQAASPLNHSLQVLDNLCLQTPAASPPSHSLSVASPQSPFFHKNLGRMLFGTLMSCVRDTPGIRLGRRGLGRMLLPS